jgi:hypothetical protein
MKALRRATRIPRARSWISNRYSPKYFQEVLKWAGKYRRALERLHHPADGSGYFAAKAG